MPKPPAFNPFELLETNATSYPPPFHEDNTRRFNRRLGDHARLTKYGVVLTRIVPGGQSSHRHAHSTQDEFIWVLEGEAVLHTDAGEQVLTAGMCAAFPRRLRRRPPFPQPQRPGCAAAGGGRPQRRRRGQLSRRGHGSETRRRLFPQRWQKVPAISAPARKSPISKTPR
jgi:mannose-6-phosphate isomerase-like protein (cupin superfamily)